MQDSKGNDLKMHDSVTWDDESCRIAGLIPAQVTVRREDGSTHLCRADSVTLEPPPLTVSMHSNMQFDWLKSQGEGALSLRTCRILTGQPIEHGDTLEVRNSDESDFFTARVTGYLVCDDGTRVLSLGPLATEETANG